MTFEQFLAANTGRFLIWDPKVGAQCVAVAEYYVRDVLGIPPVWANAVDWWGSDAAYEGWTRNAWGNRASKPHRASIVVWGPNARAGTGIYGHIAICTDPGDGLTFQAFGQNYPTGSAAATRLYAYDGVIGWGDRLQPPAPPPLDPCGADKALATSLAAQLATAIGQRDAALGVANRYAAWVALRPQ